MTGFVHGLSGPRWVKIKGAYVNLCVNVHGEPLLAELRVLEPGDCVPSLSPVLGRWLDRHILPAALAKIASREVSQVREDWETGLALFSFSPARRGGPPRDPTDPDRMTRDLCRSLPALRKCFMRQSDPCARVILNQALGNHFSDVKALLVIAELGDLSMRTWWKIEEVRREVLAEWQGEAAGEDLALRRDATERLADPQALAEGILRRLPVKLGISNWERVQLYIDVFGGPEGGFVDLEDLIGLGVDPSVEAEFILQLQSCLDAEDGPNALTDAEREAVHREYIAGTPPPA